MTQKQEFKKKLIKDLIPFVITAALMLITIIICTIAVEEFREIFAEVTIFEGIIAIMLAPLIMGFEVAGLIVGWKWLSQYIRVGSLLGFIIKLTIAALIGYILFPVILIKDIVAYCKA